jgi:hypothetical protein
MALVICVLILLYQWLNTPEAYVPPPEQTAGQSDVLSDTSGTLEMARDVLDRLPTKGRAPKTGYNRSQFSDGWAQAGACDVRNLILARDLVDVRLDSDGCTVLQGTLNDPYTGTIIPFTRGPDTSGKVQIDHVVALSDAWQKGAQSLKTEERYAFANDPLNLLAVDGDMNQQKGSSDAASWLPPNKSYRCRYVARQVAVKHKYGLWVTEAERSFIERILRSCEGQTLPLIE